MKKTIILALFGLFSCIVSAQTVWGGYKFNAISKDGDSLGTFNANDLKTFFSSGGGGGGSVATDAIFDVKGDLPVGTGANTAARLAAGTNGQPLIADNSTATGLRWGNVTINPPQITANTNDYAPTDWAKARVVFLEGDSEIRAITSFAATFDGDIKTLINDGAFTVAIACEHPDGTAANRVAGSGVYYLHPDRGIDIVYHSASSRWRMLLNGPYYDQDAMHFYGVFTPGSTTAGDIPYWTANAQGAGAAYSSALANFAIPAANTLGTGTTTTGACFMTHKTTPEPHVFGEMEMMAKAVISLPTLSNGTDRYTASFALENSPVSTTNNNNSVYIRYTDNVNGGNWQGVVRNNAGTETTVDLGVTVAASTVYQLDIYVNKQLTEVLFYVNGTFSGRINTNMPAASTTVGPRLIILKSAGTNSRVLNFHRVVHGSLFE